MKLHTSNNSNIDIDNTARSARLARTKHLLQGVHLSRAGGQLVITLDLDPGGGVVAVDARLRGLPLVGALVALLGVAGAGDGPELAALDVVGEGLAVVGGPLGGTGLYLSA